MIDQPSSAFRDAVRAVATDSGQFLTDAALDALVNAADADAGLHYLSRFHQSPPVDLVRQRLAPFLASNVETKKEGVSKWGRESGGVDPQVFASLTPLQRLTLVRQFDAKHTPAKASPKTSREKRLESDLHGARLRLHSLSGAERQKQSERIATLQAELAEAKGR